MTFVVGLTGGAASGKSTAGVLFQALGAALIDADAVSHALTGRDGKALGAIEKAFGQDFISDGALNRPRMRELVFHDKAARSELEAILHPLIARELKKAVLSSRGPYVVLEAALLVEKDSWRTLANRLLVVDVPECDGPRHRGLPMLARNSSCRGRRCSCQYGNVARAKRRRFAPTYPVFSACRKSVARFVTTQCP